MSIWCAPWLKITPPPERGRELLGPPRAVEEVGEIERGDHADRAEFTAFAELAHARDRAIEAVAVADDQDAAGARGRLDQRRAFVERDRHRLLEQHVLAMVEGERRMMGMELMRRGDVDDVDVGACAQRLDVVERGTAEVPRELRACGRQRGRRPRPGGRAGPL